ncbi:MAG TPA: dihydroorotate dehydrogenase [Clostridia bacterium]|jgi:dihydroorotate dehydrogenase (NAD+) catalytic subunit|nr:dihydroorotate dehydrogenase [Clostridia bacterium]
MNEPNLAVDFAGIKLKNPVLTASGTFGFGREYSRLWDLNLLGGIIVKAVTLEPRLGNPPPRIAETPAGILNSIGLQNPGVVSFIRDYLPFLRQYEDLPVIVNIAGNTIEDYARVAEKLSNAEGISALEVNISCPNVKQGGLAFGTDPESAYQVIEAVKANTDLPVIAKLSPNVTDITEIALSVEEAGADGISLINTLLGMAIDINSWQPILSNVVGGLSGPAVKPIAVRMVWQTAQKVSIPILGMGGIATAEDGIEFMLAGAKAIAVGTANFFNPYAAPEIVAGLKRYLKEKNIEDVNQLCGALRFTKNN